MSESNRLVVSPNGDLVVLQRTAPLKEGWRYATEEDCWRYATEEDCSAAEARAAALVAAETGVLVEEPASSEPTE